MTALKKLRIPESELENVLQLAFCRSGVPEEEALNIARILVKAEMRGLVTHGISRVPLYINRIKAGGVKVPTKLDVREDDGINAIVDANNGLGQTAGLFAMKKAIEKADKFGFGACAVKRTSHFGAAGNYAIMAAESGMIGFVFCNATPRLPAWGAKEKLIGNNPFSVSFPSMDPDAPFLLDMANSVTAAGNLRTAIREGETIPEGWALDENGLSTTDPQKALGGILLPMAGHKGYAIALAVGMITSILSGGVWDNDVGPVDDYGKAQNASSLFTALDISRWLPLDEFKERVTEIFTIVRGSALKPGVERIYYPGEREAEHFKQAMIDGVEVDQSIFRQLEILSGKRKETAS